MLFAIFWVMSLYIQMSTAEKYYLSYPLTAEPNSLNYGIKFIQDKSIFYTNDFWIHTFKIQMPNNHVYNDINTCSKDNSFPLQMGCTLGQEINTLRVNLKNTLDQLLSNFKQMVPLLDFDSMSKRAVLSFVGDIYGSLFGLATNKDVKKLAHHINILVKAMNNISSTFSNSQGNFASFVEHTNKEFKGFETFMNDSLSIRSIMIKTIVSNENQHKSIEKKYCYV